MTTCYWCKEDIVDGAEESGYAKGRDWMLPDGDFGCDAHPTTDLEEGCGPHETKEEVRNLLLKAYGEQ
jgi:hypothetical protein